MLTSVGVFAGRSSQPCLSLAVLVIAVRHEREAPPGHVNHRTNILAEYLARMLVRVFAMLDGPDTVSASTSGQEGRGKEASVCI